MRQIGRKTRKQHFQIYEDQLAAIDQITDRLVELGLLKGKTRVRNLTGTGARSELVRRILDYGLPRVDQIIEEMH